MIDLENNSNSPRVPWVHKTEKCLIGVSDLEFIISAMIQQPFLHKSDQAKELKFAADKVQGGNTRIA